MSSAAADLTTSNLDKIRELTERLEVAESLAQQQITIRDQLLDIVPALIMVLDERQILLASSAWHDQTGWAPSELVGRPWLELIHPDDRERMAKAARAMYGSNVQVQARWRGFEGEYHRLRWVSSPWTDGLAYALALHEGCCDS